MTTVSLKNKQLCALEILKAFDAFCRAEGIQYFLIGGTLLGAVRHQGFIPWDDDIDIGMPRNDYERLLKRREALPSPFRVEEMRISRSFVYPYAKIYNTNTLAVEKLAKPFVRGIWVDVFPLDGTFEGRIFRYLHQLSVRVLKILLMDKMESYAPRDHGNLRLCFRRLMYFCLLPVSRNLICKALTKVLVLKRYTGASYVGNLLGRWGNREVVPAAIFKANVELTFGNLKLFSPSGYHDYLSRIYGDYMLPPPPEQQVSCHNLGEVDLSRSYLFETKL